MTIIQDLILDSIKIIGWVDQRYFLQDLDFISMFLVHEPWPKIEICLYLKVQYIVVLKLWKWMNIVLLT